MIDDLKADSLRWDKERRAQTARSNTPGGSFVSRDASGVPARLSSNSPIGQYRLSETHQSRQHYGPSEADAYPRYPGSGSGGFIGAAATYDRQQPPPQQQHPAAGGYGYQPPPSSQPIQQNLGYSGSYPQGPQGMDRGFSQNQDNQSPYVHTGANMSVPPRGDYGSNDAFVSRMPPAPPPQQPVYATSAPSQPGYPAATYPYPGQIPSPAGGQPYQNMHPQDVYGRGEYHSPIHRQPLTTSPPTLSDFVVSPAGQGSQQPQVFAAQGQQYGETPSSRTSVPPQPAPTPSSGANKRRSDRDDDRHTPTERHSRQQRR